MLTVGATRSRCSADLIRNGRNLINPATNNTIIKNRAPLGSPIILGISRKRKYRLPGYAADDRTATRLSVNECRNSRHKDPCGALDGCGYGDPGWAPGHCVYLANWHLIDNHWRKPHNPCLRNQPFPRWLKGETYLLSHSQEPSWILYSLHTSGGIQRQWGLLSLSG